MRKKAKTDNLSKSKIFNESLAEISEPSDLIGKKIWHRFYSAEVGEDRWYEGVVLQKSGDEFEVRYDDDSETYCFKLMEDYENGDICWR